MFVVYICNPKNHHFCCPIAEFKSEKDARSYCDLYDWQVLHPGTGEWYDMEIKEMFKK